MEGGTIIENKEQVVVVVEKEKEEIAEHSLSFQFCHFIVHRNLLAFGLAVLAQTSFPVITALLYMCNSDVLPIDFTDIPLLLFEDPTYRRAAAWGSRNRDMNEPILLDPSFLNQSQLRHQFLYRQYTADYIELYYQIDNADQSDFESGNILTAPYLEQIARFESSLLRLPHYDRFCILRQLGKCEPVDSIVRYLPFLIHHHNDSIGSNRSNGEEIPKSPNEKIWAKIRSMSVDPDHRRILVDHLGINARIDTYPPYSNKLRSIFRVSWVNYDPRIQLRTRDNETSESEEENSSEDTTSPAALVAKIFIKEILSPTLWNYCKNGLPDFNSSVNIKPIRFSYYNLFLYYDRLHYQCWDDEAFAFGSLAFIFLFLWFQTRSFFLAIFGMYFILTNFVGGNLLYRYIFDFRYFGVFNALAIFLVLAVGVDEIFVFEETWSATGQRAYPSLVHRLYDCYRKCSLSILVPTLATAIALIQTALCPLMALSCFGSFAACVVVLNYFSIVTYFPCVLIFHHIHIDPNCRYRRSTRISSALGDNNDGESSERAHRFSQKACHAYCALFWKPIVQAICLMITACLLGFLIYSATKITIDKDQPKLYTESHPLGASLKMKETDFPTPLYYHDSQFVQLYLVWGIKDWDRSGCHKNEWKTCNGRVVWDDNFDLNPFPAQLDLLTICQRLRHLSGRELDDLMVRMAPNGSQSEIGCFVDDMDNYFREEMKTFLYQEHKSLGGLPSTQVKVEALMLHVPQIYNLTQLLENPFFYRYFEIANLYWLNDGYKFLFPRSPFSSHTYRRHALLLGHSLNSTDLKTAHYGNYSFVYGTKLRYAAIIINTTIPRHGLRYDEGLKIFDKWQRLFENLTADIHSPQLKQSGFVIAPDANADFGSGIWHWLVVQKVLITSAWQGVIIGVGLALPILIIFTDDFLVGTLTTLTIACTSVSIIGIIPLTGWKLGLLESLNLTLVADLAIDHIVHVAEGYQLSKKPTRKEKVEDLLHEAGVSIISGAMTTVGASVFLLFAKIVFFMQFGLFILFTVALSIVYALGLLVVLLALIGPEDDRYSVSKWAGLMKRGVVKLILKYLNKEKNNGNKGNMENTAKIDHPNQESPAQLAVFTTPTSAIVTTLPAASQSVDEDNISSGYESPGGGAGAGAGAVVESDGCETPSLSLNSAEPPGSVLAWSPNRGTASAIGHHYRYPSCGTRMRSSRVSRRNISLKSACVGSVGQDRQPTQEEKDEFDW